MESPPEVSPAPPDLAPQYLEAQAAIRLEAGLEIEDADVGRLIAEEKAISARVSHARIAAGELGGAVLRDLRLVDVAAESLDAANGDWRGASLTRVSLSGCRLTGLTLVEASLRDVLFDDCKLDLANLRAASFERVVFRECVFTGADFGAATLTDVRFDDCRLEETDFNATRLTNVDLRGSDLSVGGDIASLRGAIIDTGQAIDLSSRTAASLGLRVVDH